MDIDSAWTVRAPDPGYAALKSVKLAEVRAVFSPRCYRRSTWRAIGALLVDVGLYGAAVIGVFASGNPLLRLACGALAGVAVAFLFVWAHDAAHGALFTSDIVAEVLGTAAMLPSLQMYRLWVYGHNKVHHGFTSFSPIDWIWRPLTPAEYEARSWWQRGVYRLERHPATCGLHYLLRVWWSGMVRFRPPEGRRRVGYRWSKLGTLTYLLAFSAVAYRFAGGPVGVFAAVVLPFLVFTYIIALVVYLHHTHPDVPFFTDRQEWAATIGQLACSIVVRSNALVERLTHNILIHPPHHIDTRIPFYNLKLAYADLLPAFGQYVCESRLRWSTVRSIFSQCQLYDFDTHTWHRFAELKERETLRPRAGVPPVGAGV
jgi:omega-6 fatty acid desaturase (delta-12 desaturase)